MLRYNVVAVKHPLDESILYKAKLAPVQPLTLDQLAKDVSEQSTITEHDIKAVLSSLQEQLYKHLRNGNSVRLGDIGTFRLTLRYFPGAPTAKEIKTADIHTHVTFIPSSRIKGELSVANPVVKFIQEPKAPVPPLSPADGGGTAPEQQAV